ncbi:MAG: twin-arginine translocase TatA/TatE family subunit [Prevotella sp.]|nr:twin-arginine translocase TatA/TatE family subunit [Prevotella sp.]
MIYQLLFIGTTELLLIGGMALLLFGGKKLPEMMRGLGQGVKEFKKGMESPSDFTQDESREDGVRPKTDNINERETDGKE